MRVMLVGSGGREAALAWRLSRDPALTDLVVTAPNPGWPDGAVEHRAATVPEWVDVAQRAEVDLVVVGPEVPLDLGLADALAAVGIPCFGPQRAAARLESSKAFAKEVMHAAGVATAAALVVRLPEDLAAARARCDRGAVVVKADGLAAGKGVFVCPTAAEAHAALDAAVELGDSARTVVLEELLDGPEVSMFGLSDGSQVAVLPSAQDHKQLLDGGEGPNTGGMGAYVPCPLVDAEQGDALCAAVLQPIVDELARRGTPFVGVLFAGLMLTADGPKVLEYNVRFGDPECQPLMALWTDPLPWLHGAATGALPSGRPQFEPGSACCVVLASAGYPRSSTKGTVIPRPDPLPGVVVFQAGTALDPDGVLRTSGGRVLGITAKGATLEAARALAYEALPGWRFEGAQFRTDIAASPRGSAPA